MTINEIKKGILKGSFYTSFGQLISILFLFISTAILARFTSANELGLFFLVLSISSLLEIFAALGLEPALIKFQSQVTSENRLVIFNKLFTLRLLTQLIITIFFSVSTLIIESFNKEDWLSYNYYILILFNISSIRNFLNADLQSNKLFKLLTIAQLIQTISKVCAYLLIAYTISFNIKNLIIIEIISISISIIFQFHLFKDKIKIHLIGSRYIKETISFSFPLYLNNFLNIFSARSNNFIIAYFAGLADVANYEISKKFPDAFNRLASSLTLVYYPYVAELFGGGKNELAEKVLNSYLKNLFLISVPILIIFYLVKENLIIIAFTSKYAHTSLSVFFLLSTYLFSFASSIMGYTLVASGNPKLSFRINFTRSIVTLFLSLPLTYFFAFKGAIYSLLISNIFSFLISIFYLNKIKLYVDVISIIKSIFIMIVIVALIYIFDIFFNRSFNLTLIIVFITSIIYLFFNKKLRKMFFSLIGSSH